MARHGFGRLIVDTYITIIQRQAVCQDCGTTYNGPKEHVKCKGCGETLETNDVRCHKKVPTGTWNVTTLRRKAGDVSGS